MVLVVVVVVVIVIVVAVVVLVLPHSLSAASFSFQSWRGLPINPVRHCSFVFQNDVRSSFRFQPRWALEPLGNRLCVGIITPAGTTN